MRYLFVFTLVFLSISSAEAQVAKISSGGTTIYSAEKEVYIPRYPQTRSQSGEYKNQKDNSSEVQNTTDNRQQEENIEKMQDNPVMKVLRSPLKNYGDQRTARNILLLREVVDFKLGDEKLEKEIKEVEQNREYAEKMESIMEKLSNKKLRNSKNKEVIRILDDAGNKIYNLLAD